MRQLITLAALLVVMPAQAATIHLEIGGDFHLTEPAPFNTLILTTDHTG